MKLQETFEKDVDVYYWKNPATYFCYSNETILNQFKNNETVDESKNLWFKKYSIQTIHDLRNNYTEVDNVTAKSSTLDILSFVEGYFQKWSSQMFENDTAMKKREQQLIQDGSLWPHQRMTYGDCMKIEKRLFVIVAPGPSFPTGIMELVVTNPLQENKYFVCKK